MAPDISVDPYHTYNSTAELFEAQVFSALHDTVPSANDPKQTVRARVCVYEFFKEILSIQS